MRIACPVCSANYEVPDQMLGPGRTVRCGKCGHQWVPEPAPTRAAAPPPPPPAPAPTLAAAAPPPRPLSPPPPSTLAPPPPPAPTATVMAEPPQRITVRERMSDVSSVAEEAPRLAERRQRSSADLFDRSRLNEPAEPAYQPEPARAGAAVWFGWLVSIVIWGLVVWAAYAFRTQLMEAWPPIQRLYAAIGLGPGS